MRYLRAGVLTNLFCVIRQVDIIRWIGEFDINIIRKEKNAVANLHTPIGRCVDYNFPEIRRISDMANRNLKKSAYARISGIPCTSARSDGIIPAAPMVGTSSAPLSEKNLKKIKEVTKITQVTQVAPVTRVPKVARKYP